VNCDDGDDCTDDVCDPVAGCQHPPRPGLDLVSCRLDLLATALVTSPVAELGGAAARARYSARVGKARRMVDAARRVPARRKLAMLRRAGHVLGAFSQAIRRAATRHKMQEGIATRLLQLTSGAVTSLANLTQ
jgi:hypothetical protein